MSHAAKASRRVSSSQAAVWRLREEPLIRGSARGPLDGYRVAVKDVFAIRGHAIGLGHPAWLRDAPIEQRHADVVELLLKAGSDIRGIAQTDPFAYSMTGSNPHYGAPANASAPGALTGGSSSGPASAVSSGEAEIGLGTDTAGSIRVPSSYCGLHGFRPTHGRVSMRGVVPLAPSFDTVGWMARDAEVIRRVGGVLLPFRLPQPVTRLVLAEDLFRSIDFATGEALRRAAISFAERAGITLENLDLCAGDLDAWASAFRVVQSHEAWQVHGEWVSRHPDGLGAAITERFIEGSEVTSAQLSAARRVITAARAQLRQVVPDGTAVLQPAASSPPPPVHVSERRSAETRTELIRLTCPAGLAGLPVATIPAVSTTAGPVGLSITGAFGSDADLLRLVQVQTTRATESRST